MPFSVVILAGGRSSRFGKDKLLQEFKGKKVVENVVEAAKDSEAEEVIIALKKLTEDYEKIINKYNLIYAQDYIAESTPLAGLCAGARASKNRDIVVISGDSPLVDPYFFNFMGSALKGLSCEAAVPLWPDGKIEAIHATYAKLPVLRACDKMTKMKDLEVKRIPLYLNSVYFIPVEELNKKALFDADTEEELEALKKL